MRRGIFDGSSPRDSKLGRSRGEKTASWKKKKEKKPRVENARSRGEERSGGGSFDESPRKVAAKSPRSFLRRAKKKNSRVLERVARGCFRRFRRICRGDYTLERTPSPSLIPTSRTRSSRKCLAPNLPACAVASPSPNVPKACCTERRNKTVARRLRCATPLKSIVTYHVYRRF